jgi:hypothetical protein
MLRLSDSDWLMIPLCVAEDIQTRASTAFFSIKCCHCSEVDASS